MTREELAQLEAQLADMTAAMAAYPALESMLRDRLEPLQRQIAMAQAVQRQNDAIESALSGLPTDIETTNILLRKVLTADPNGDQEIIQRSEQGQETKVKARFVWQAQVDHACIVAAEKGRKGRKGRGRRIDVFTRAGESFSKIGTYESGEQACKALSIDTHGGSAIKALRDHDYIVTDVAA